MSYKNTLPNPYGREKLDLSNAFIPAANKEWFARDILAKNHTGVYWDKMYNLAPDSSSRWSRLYKTNGFISEPGRPPIFHTKDKNELKVMVQRGDYDTRTVDFNLKAQELAVNRQVNTFKREKYDTTIPSVSVMKRLDVELGLKNANAEKTTIARANAISDIRNLASFAAATHFMVPTTNLNLMINADATQCRTSGEITRKVRVKVNKGRNSSIDPMKVLPVKNESLTAFFIKYYMIFSAGGSLAPPIFIIANDDMKEGVINVQKVNGLGMGVDPNPIGYLVFCKSRGLCHEFYEWMLNEIVVPYVNKIKLHKSLNNDSTSWLTLDGESKQIIPMMKEGSQMILNDNNIIVTKPPGSTSHVTQPADVGKVFKAIKTTIVGLFDDNLNDNDLKDEIMIKIKCHEESNMKNMTAAYRQKICTGPMKMHRAIKKVINPDII